jgi:hypothetical protein
MGLDQSWLKTPFAPCLQGTLVRDESTKINWNSAACPGGMAVVNGDPIDEYLAQLRAGLRTSPTRTAEILAEAEDHLRESAAAARMAGQLSETGAQRAAIEAFGPVRAITRAHRPPLTAFAAAVAMQAWPLLTVYVLLVAVLGGLVLWADGGRTIVPVEAPPAIGGRSLTALWVGGLPRSGPLAATFGGCLLVAVLLAAGFLITRRRRKPGCLR